MNFNKTDNQIIADFMDYPGDNSSRDPYLYAMKHAYENDMMNYHNKWEWIMPVVNKLKSFAPPPELFTETLADGMSNMWMHVESSLKSADLEKVHRSCVNMLKWYHSYLQVWAFENPKPVLKTDNEH